MQMSENKMIVADALSRIDSVLDTEPVPVSDEPQHPKDGYVKLSDVHFSYYGKTEVIKGVSMDIKSGQTVALYSYLDPIAAIFFSALLLGEGLTLRTALGAALVLGATLLGEAG